VRLGHLVDSVRNPAQLVLTAFVALAAVGTLLLRLPFAIDEGAPSPDLVDAAFWSTSASTVTGLSTIDVRVFSTFGELVLLALVQVGGFGVMTIGAALALAASRRLGLRQRMLAKAELGAGEMGELKALILAIARITIVVELAIAIVLFATFRLRHGEPVGRAAYSAVFHAVTAFNNAGISLHSDNLVRYRDDPFVVLPMSLAFIVGGLGFPVLVEFIRRVRPSRWTLNTRITLLATAGLLVIGPVLVLALEWGNPLTLGPMNLFDKLLAAWFQGTSPRTAGFNTIDLAAQTGPTLNVQSALMFIGAGPASTSGGIKVTTFAVLGFAMWAEVRGDEDVNAFGRRLSPRVQRQALTMALLAIGAVFGLAIILSALSDLPFTSTLYESASAFGTTGLSVGVSAVAPEPGQWLLLGMMLLGRVGPMTFVSALALRETSRAYRFPEERPLIG
jgi:trk system potassium uptake protein TrkH